MKELRDYQHNLSRKGAEILSQHKMVYYALEVRTGKTVIALNTVGQYWFYNGAQPKVLFITKKKAISSIEKDYVDFGYNTTFELDVTNYESAHKVDADRYDILILDEAHRLGAFPKPSTAARRIKDMFAHLPIIYLSGTPTPESYSQIYHQLWVSNYSPFHEYRTFYKWANTFVHKKVRYLAHGAVNDYSGARKEMIDPLLDPIKITFTQQQAGFSTTINEEVISVPVPESLGYYIDKIQKDRVIQGNNDAILADTSVKLQQKLHQIYSGTVVLESGKRIVISKYKAIAIYNKFKGVKIGIFYKFVAELEAIQQVYGDQITTDLDEFNASPTKSIALQIVSGREGISLRNAEAIVFYNIDFSAVSYWQARDRMTTKDRTHNKVYWVFSESGIEHKIYQAVMNKKDYTLSQFKKDYAVV